MYPNLKLQLWKSGMRQNRLAQLVGIHETLLSKIVNGFRVPDSAVRSRIALVLRTDAEWLFAQTIPLPDGRGSNCGSDQSRDRQGVGHGPRRATKGDENDLDLVYDAGLERGVEEVVNALEKSRPLGSLIRMACCEPISVHCPTGKEGR
jgi:transcriptional regulator with XRE-family HTH domain